MRDDVTRMTFTVTTKDGRRTVLDGSVLYSFISSQLRSYVERVPNTVLCYVSP